MTDRRRCQPFLATGALALGLAIPGVLLAQNRQDQVHPDAAGPAAQTVAVHRPAVQDRKSVV